MERDKKNMITLTGHDEVIGEAELAMTGAVADAGEVSIADNWEAGAYELEVDGQTAAGLLYRETGTRVALLATSVFPEFRGKGIAGKLLGGVLVMLREEGRTATLTCPFATSFVRSHPEYADVVDPIYPGNARSQGHGRMP